MFAFTSKNTLGFCAMVVALLSVTIITLQVASAEPLVATSGLTAGADAAAVAVPGQKAISGARKTTSTSMLTPGSGGIRQRLGSLHKRWDDNHCHDDCDDRYDDCCDNDCCCH